VGEVGYSRHKIGGTAYFLRTQNPSVCSFSRMMQMKRRWGCLSARISESRRCSHCCVHGMWARHGRALMTILLVDLLQM